MAQKTTQKMARFFSWGALSLTNPILLVSVGVLFLAVAGGLAWVAYDGSKVPELVVATPPIERPARTQSLSEDVEQPPAGEVSSDRVEAEQTPSTIAEASFDVVRVDPDGNAVMAGRAPARSHVTIMDGKKELGHAQVDARGEWVFLPDAPLRSGSRELTLKAVTAQGSDVPSRDLVILVVPKSKGATTLAVRADRRTGESTLLQGIKTLPPGRFLSIDAIDYDKRGYLAVSGRTGGAGLVRVYLDNVAVGDTRINDRGVWRIRSNKSATLGSHQVRSDFLNADGSVRERVELAFERIELDSMPEGRRVVVQGGNSLWRLARRTYGDGFAYTIIYDTNKGKISDPNLIYPGQVFVVPPIGNVGS